MEQKDIVEFQMMNAELEQLHGFLQNLDEQVLHVNKLVDDLAQFAKQKPGDEVFFPIANGLFVKGTLGNTKEIHVNVGQGVVVPRTIEQAQTLIKEQADNLVEQQAAATKRQEEIYARMEALEKKVSDV